MSSNSIRKIGLIGLTMIMMIGTLSGCRSKCIEGGKNYPACLGTNEPTKEKPTVTLTFWNLSDNEEVFRGAIQRFEKKPREGKKVKIEYKSFSNEEKYEEYLMSKIAEGEGPDIFAMHHSWFPRHEKKIMPMPEAVGMNPQIFRDTFQDVAARVLIRHDKVADLERIYGLPLYIDTLALYYNKNLFKLLLPDKKNKPAETWEEIKSQVVQIKEEDPNGLERFKVTGIAMGRNDNIRYAVDILSLLFLQQGVELFDKDLKTSILSKGKNESGPAAEQAFDLYTSFEVGSVSIHANWNQFITGMYPKEKELGAFVRGKVAMIFGYSTMYKELEGLIKEHEKERDEKPIKATDIGIIEVPQILSPKDQDVDSSVTLADFYPLTVSAATSEEKGMLAWEFLRDIAIDQEVFLKQYNELTRKPSALIAGISETQRRDNMYGVFARQIQTSKILPIMNKRDYSQITSYAISKFKKKAGVLSDAETQLQCVLEASTEKSKNPDKDCTEGI